MWEHDTFYCPSPERRVVKYNIIQQKHLFKPLFCLQKLKTHDINDFTSTKNKCTNALMLHETLQMYLFILLNTSITTFN